MQPYSNSSTSLRQPLPPSTLRARVSRINVGANAVATSCLADITDRELAQLRKGMATAEEQSHLLHEQGYVRSLSLPNGTPCEPGVVCVRRPLALVKPGEPGFYLVSFFPDNPEHAADPDAWHYSCGCKFYQRTLAAFGKGTCKHGMWSLRFLQAALARQAFVNHILAVLPAAPAAMPTVTATQRVFDRETVLQREQEVLTERRERFATALHKDRDREPLDLAALPSGPTVYPAVPPTRGSFPVLPAPSITARPSKPGHVKIASGKDF